VNCPSCHTENPPGRKFCRECGKPLSLACPQCGAVNVPGDKFCGECGTSFETQPVRSTAGSPPVVAAQLPTAERKHVSVLFADLVGFTTLSESRDPEETRELLTRYFDAARRVISRYGGTVEKFIGDAVMAVWGTPTAKEDDSERAVRAALDLVEAVEALGSQVDAANLKARAGVLTGEAAVTVGAEGQGMVAGDIVNTASRIQSAADPGAVLVGEATRRASEAAIVYEAAGAHELKGKAEPVSLWRAVRVIAGVGGALRATGLEAPFVGRDRELRLIKELFHASTEEAKAHLVSVVGTAGMGKSRLSWEFFKYIDGLVTPLWWHRGRCLAYGEGVTYWALAEMVRMRARIEEGEDPAAGLSKLHDSVIQHVADAEERKWIEPRLAHLLGLEERTAGDRQDLFSAWRVFFERLAEVNPVIMVFEDIQWADEALLDFIESTLDWSRNHPIFVMTLARPDFIERHPNWGAGKRNFTSLFLEPLPERGMEELLAGLAPGLPDELRTRILAHAEGVPLYAVETVRMLIDRGLLVQEGTRYRLAGPVEALDIPETLHALIAARLDGLAPEERRLLQDAAVLGKTFTKQALASVTGIQEQELDQLLSSLIHKEVLSYQTDPRSLERGQYGFLQDLVRRVAYEMLSRQDRKLKHLAVAGYLQSQVHEEDEIVEVIASHYVQAWRAAPDAGDAEQIKDKAREALVQAGGRAASLAANLEAQGYYEQAIELGVDDLAAAELHERAGRMARLGNRAEAARSHFERAIATFESIGLTHPAARVSAALAEVMWDEGHIEEALERMGRAFQTLSSEEPDEDLATLAAQLGRFLFFSGQPGPAMERIEFALWVAEVLQIPEVFSQALNTKAIILQSRGRMQEGMTLLKQALSVALENNLSGAALRAYNNLAAFMNYSDRHRDELEVVKDGIELARRTGNRPWEVGFMGGSVTPLAYLGRWDELVSLADQVREADDFPALRGGLPELVVMARIWAHRGDHDKAADWLEAFLEAGESGDVQMHVGYRVAQATVLRSEGRLDEALAAAEEALAARDELGMFNEPIKESLIEVLEASFALGDVAKVEDRLALIEALRPGELTPYLQAQGARFGGRLSARRGENDQVESALIAAESLFREMEMPFWLAVTLLEHGEWLVREARGQEAEPVLDQAEGIFESLKARPWLDRLEVARRAALTVPASSGVGGSP
jgi:class 3 adenylate cyclase/tetratricopeptide (TPR) repeat protein